MHGKILITLKGVNIHLWFNNFSKEEIAKIILPKDGNFPAKPEEFPLLNAIERLATENYLYLMRDITWSGILGQAFATDTPTKFKKSDIAELIATSSDDELNKVWTCFLSAMGVNVDQLETTLKEGETDKKKV